MWLKGVSNVTCQLSHVFYMKWEEIAGKSKEELEALLREARAKMVDLRFRIVSGSLKQVHEVARARKMAARIMTRLAQPMSDATAKPKHDKSE